MGILPFALTKRVVKCLSSITCTSKNPIGEARFVTHDAAKERYHSVCQLRVMVCKDSDRY